MSVRPSAWSRAARTRMKATRPGRVVAHVGAVVLEGEGLVVEVEAGVVALRGEVGQRLDVDGPLPGVGQDHGHGPGGHPVDDGRHDARSGGTRRSRKAFVSAAGAFSSATIKSARSALNQNGDSSRRLPERWPTSESELSSAQYGAHASSPGRRAAEPGPRSWTTSTAAQTTVTTAQTASTIHATGPAGAAAREPRRRRRRRRPPGVRVDDRARASRRAWAPWGPREPVAAAAAGRWARCGRTRESGGR